MTFLQIANLDEKNVRTPTEKARLIAKFFEHNKNVIPCLQNFVVVHSVLTQKGSSLKNFRIRTPLAAICQRGCHGLK